ncbi:MAG: PAS domain-containing protein [Alphaproteobacteria bacterium]
MTIGQLEHAVSLITEEERMRSAVITDATQPDNPIIFVSDAFEMHTGYSRREAVGRNPRFLQGPQTNLEDTAAFRKAIAAGDTAKIDIMNYRKDGTPFVHRVHLKAIRNDAGEITNFVAVQQPIVPED